MSAGGEPPPGAALPASAQPAARLRPGHLYRAAGLLFLLAWLLWHLPQITRVLLLMYAAAIAAVLLNAVVSRVPLPRRWAAPLVVLALMGAAAGGAWLAVPPLTDQVRSLAYSAPALESRLQATEGWIRHNTGLNVELVGPQAERALRSAFLSTAGPGEVLARARGLLEVLLIPVLITFGALFAAASPNRHLLVPVMRAFPRELRPAVRRIVHLLGRRILGWARGTLIGMLSVGVLTWVLLLLIGVPNALVLGVFSGITEVVPVLGPWIGGAVATAVAFLYDPAKAAWTALAALAIQQFENNVIIPWAMSRSVHLHPLVTLFAVLLFGSLFGILGVLLSLPLVILAWTVVQVLWVERAVGSRGERIAPVVRE